MLPWSIRPSRIQLSLTYCSSFILFGLIGAGIGPLIPIKAKEMGIKQTDFGIAFMLKGAGGLLGSFVAPLLESYMKLNKILSLSCMLLGVCSAVISDTNSMLIFTSMFFLLGISIMIINILCTVALIRIMPKLNTEAWIKALHFSFGIGAFMSPLFTSFLGPASFKVFPALALVNMLLLIFYDHPESQRVSSIDPEGTTEEEILTEKRPIPPALDTALVIFMFCYAGVEVSFWGWISTFGIMSEGITNEQAIYSSSVFWVCMTMGRGLVIPLSYVLSTSRQIILLLSGIFVAILMCIYFVMKSQDLNALYIGSSFMGLFCSGVYPLTMNLPNSLGMKTSTKNTSKYALGGSIGETILPFLAGMAIAHLGQNSLFIWELVLVALSIGVYKYSLDIAHKTITNQTDIELTLTKGDLYRQLED